MKRECLLTRTQVQQLLTDKHDEFFANVALQLFDAGELSVTQDSDGELYLELRKPQ
jgi:hypothetical protein